MPERSSSNAAALKSCRSTCLPLKSWSATETDPVPELMPFIYTRSFVGFFQTSPFILDFILFFFVRAFSKAMNLDGLCATAHKSE